MEIEFVFSSSFSLRDGIVLVSNMKRMVVVMIVAIIIAIVVIIVIITFISVMLSLYIHVSHFIIKIIICMASVVLGTFCSYNSRLLGLRNLKT